MEITNIKETMISPLLQDSTSGHVKKSGQTHEEAGRTKAAKELINKVFQGVVEDAKGLLDKEIKVSGGKGQQDFTDETLKNLATRMNQVAESMRYQIQFVVDRESDGVIIKVLDSEGKVIRQIPPEVMAAVSSEAGINLGVLLNTQL